MSKDTISVNMNVYDIPIVVEQLKKLEQENKQLKERIDKAIEYIKQYGNLYCLKDKQFKDYQQYKDLLDILKGSDKSE